MTLSELERLDGLYVGQLDAMELAMFDVGMALGMCVRSYEGLAGFMGLAKVRVLRLNEVKYE